MTEWEFTSRFLDSRSGIVFLHSSLSLSSGLRSQPLRVVGFCRRLRFKLVSFSPNIDPIIDFISMCKDEHNKRMSHRSTFVGLKLGGFQGISGSVWLYLANLWMFRKGWETGHSASKGMDQFKHSNAHKAWAKVSNSTRSMNSMCTLHARARRSSTICSVRVETGTRIISRWVWLRRNSWPCKPPSLVCVRISNTPPNCISSIWGWPGHGACVQQGSPI
jgi:hypothetical protein